MLGSKAEQDGFGLKYVPSSPSTNQWALDFSSNLTPAAQRELVGQAGIWFVTDEQTKGRGRRGRVWKSYKGNLSASVLVVLPARVEGAQILSFVAAIALAEALKKLLDENSGNIKLKWPNDVLLSGQKLAGILLEAQFLSGGLSDGSSDGSSGGERAIAIGMGVNVKQSPSEMPYPVTAIAKYDGSISSQLLFEVLSDSWAEAFSVWDYGLGRAKVLSRWLELAFGIGKAVSVEQSGKTISGIFDDIDNDGCMLVTQTNGQKLTITAGDVQIDA